MKSILFRTSAACTAVILISAIGPLFAQQAVPAHELGAAADANKDGAITREEFKAVFETWLSNWFGGRSGGLTLAQVATALNAALPKPATPGAAAPPKTCGGRSLSPQSACQTDIDKMLAAVPDKAPAKPLQPRRVLVLASAGDYVHSSIPLAAKTVDAVGSKTGAWKTTITYDPADINTDNLKQYDAIFLDSTTGCFLDDPADKAATGARHAALLAFVRGGKGIAAIHAASDSYHGSSCDPAATGMNAGSDPTTPIARSIVIQGDKNADNRLTRAELSALTEAWFDKLDTGKAGRVTAQEFGERLGALMSPPGSRGGGRGQSAPGGQPLWPEWNTIIGGYFKFHWNNPQLITVKIDDPRSPLTAPFNGAGFEIRDETYTFNQESFSRANVHVLTSVDYDKMSAEDKAKESNPRTDHDYGLSWIRREGNGRVFYEAHGHDESIYAMRPMLEHILAGIQYALGDLKADDSPSVKK